MIPAYNPDGKMISLLDDLYCSGYQNIILIDDGNREDTKVYFEKARVDYGCKEVSHSINLGQDRA